MYHNKFMQEAVIEAEIAGARGDRPIGAVIVCDNQILARGSSRFKTLNSHVHHAENTMILENASIIKSCSAKCIVYTTVEPCVMCLPTIILANIRSVVYGIPDPFMNSSSIINNNSYLSGRLDLYLGKVLYDECVTVFRKHSSKRDIDLLIENHSKKN